MNKELTEEQMYFLEMYKDSLSEEEILEILEIFEDESMELE